MNGFYLVELIVSGNKHVSNITFEKGLNIIYGGSDIGKTFIFQCIEYMLGSEHKPKEIKELKDYYKCELTIKKYTGEQYILMREFNGKKYELRGSKGLLAKSIDGISKYLLEFTNMKDKTIKIDNYERISKMTFNQLKRYFLVDEDAILIKNSYITGQTLHERNVLKFLLTGLEAKPIESILSQAEVHKLQGELNEIKNNLLSINTEITNLDLFSGSLINEQSQLKAEIISLKESLKAIETKIMEQTIEIEMYQKKIVCPNCKRELICPNCTNKDNDIKLSFFTLDEDIKRKNDLITKLEIKESIFSENRLQLSLLKKLKKDKEYYEKREKELTKTITTAESKLKTLKKSKKIDFSLTPITTIMLEILKDIKFENINDVKFSKEDSDFIINNQHRILYGQGYRAIIYATFILAILKYLKNKDYQIGFMMIDSPLNPYKPKENNEDLNLADNYYEYLATNQDVEDRQVIIFENTKVPSRYTNKIRDLDKDGFLKTSLF